MNDAIGKPAAPVQFIDRRRIMHAVPDRPRPAPVTFIDRRPARNAPKTRPVAEPKAEETIFPSSRAVARDSCVVYVGRGMFLEAALLEFKKRCTKAGIVDECFRRQAYTKPGAARRQKSRAARRRLAKHGA